MLAYFERQRIYANNGPRLGAKYITSDGKRTYVKFNWEGDDLVTDNKDTFRPLKDYPALQLKSELAEKMGWVKKNGSGYELGPNLLDRIF